MTEEELSVLKRMVCSFENLLWYSVLFICYSRLSFSFVDSFIVMDEYDAIFVFTFTVFLRIRGSRYCHS